MVGSLEAAAAAAAAVLHSTQEMSTRFESLVFTWLRERERERVACWLADWLNNQKRNSKLNQSHRRRRRPERPRLPLWCSSRPAQAFLFRNRRPLPYRSLVWMSAAVAAERICGTNFVSLRRCIRSPRFSIAWIRRLDSVKLKLCNLVAINDIPFSDVERFTGHTLCIHRFTPSISNGQRLLESL